MRRRSQHYAFKGPQEPCTYLFLYKCIEHIFVEHLLCIADTDLDAGDTTEEEEKKIKILALTEILELTLQ